jgi:dihydroorotase-like cyclic amidohydrolase
MEAIIAAAITGGVTLAVCLVNNHYQSSATRKLIEYKLEELTKRVDKHNNVIERTYKLEKIVELHSEKISVANHRIDDLERSE